MARRKIDNNLPPDTEINVVLTMTYGEWMEKKGRMKVYNPKPFQKGFHKLTDEI